MQPDPLLKLSRRMLLAQALVMLPIWSLPRQHRGAEHPEQDNDRLLEIDGWILKRSDVG